MIAIDRKLGYQALPGFFLMERELVPTDCHRGE
jgi:hypothetical protein